MALAMISKAPALRPQVRSRAQGPRRGRIGLAKPAPVTPLGPGPVIQPKLTVGAPNDRFEQEADRVADRVMRMPDPTHTDPVSMGGTAAAEGIQRLCSECEEEVRRQPLEEEEEELQMKRAPGATPEIGPGLQARIGGLRGGGRPLSLSTRGFFEPRFGYDFSLVRVHTDGTAADVARSINARAFTMGRNVVFGQGQYAPGSGGGKRLLAHELTHVVQQGGATIQRAGLPTDDEKGVETEPDEMGAKALAHDPKPAAQQETSANIQSPNRLGINASVPDGSSSLQRVADKSNQPTNLNCDRVDSGPAGPGGTHIDFAQGGQALNAANRELIEAEFDAWVARGSVDRMTVDGFASSEGPSGLNWRISCNRAEAVKAEFVRLGVPVDMVTTIAHGETEEFSATALPPNRRAVIRIVRTPHPDPDPGCPTTITANTTLTTDCTNNIVIAADSIVFDCAGHTLTGPGTGNGILLRGRTGVRIVNCRVTNFTNGIALRDSPANTFTNNSSFGNTVDGVDINDSNGNIFIQNNVSDNTDHGIELDGSSANRFIQNTVTGNDDGFDTEGPPRGGPPAPDNIFIRNNANNNRGAGFRILSNGNVISGNSSNNNRDGFRIQGNDNTLNDNNNASSNTRDGFRIQGNDNTLSGNRGSGNRSQDLDVRDTAVGTTCRGNTFGTTNGRCPPDFP